MANFETAPEFNELIRKFETTDPAHADLFNAVIGVLLNNDVFLKMFASQLRQLIEGHIADRQNPHGMDKLQMGIEKVNNTSDQEKPVSTAQQAALDDLYQQLTAYTRQKIAELINGAPTSMDILKEVSDAIAAHKSVMDALDAAIGKKANQAEMDSLLGTKLDKTGDASNVTNTFTQADTRVNLSTKEKLSVSLGKIMKWFADIANGAASTLLGANLTANRVVVTNGSGKLAESSVTSTELGFLAGVKSRIQEQLNELNTGLSKKRTVYTSLDALGITSTFIPDIIAAMPKNTAFMTLINSTGIYDNAANKLSELKISSGILTIDKAESYVRVIVTTNNSGGSNGCLYIGNIDTNNKKVNKWYEIDAAKIDELSTALAGKAATNHTHDAKKITLNSQDNYFECDSSGKSEIGPYNNVEEYLKSISKSIKGLTEGKLSTSGGTVIGDVSLTAGKKLRIGDVAYLTSIASNSSEWTFGNGIGVHITNGDNSWRALRPNTDNNMTLGATNERWQNVFAGSSAISTSDRNLKKDITPISDKYLKFFALLQPVTYRFKDGTSNRIHVGFISQDVEAAMAQVGFTDLDFAGFCRDKMQREVKTMHQQPVFDGNGDPLLDDDGKPIMSEWYDISYEDVLDDDGAPVYIYSLRYEEFIALNTAVIQRQRQHIDMMDQRLHCLEERFNEVKH